MAQTRTAPTTTKRRPRWAWTALVGFLLCALAVLAGTNGYPPTAALLGFIGFIALVVALVGFVVTGRRR